MIGGKLILKTEVVEQRLPARLVTHHRGRPYLEPPLPGAPLALGPGQQLRLKLAIGLDVRPQRRHLLPRNIERPAPALFLPIEVVEGAVRVAAGTHGRWVSRR